MSWIRRMLTIWLILAVSVAAGTIIFMILRLSNYPNGSARIAGGVMAVMVMAALRLGWRESRKWQ